MSTMQTLAPLCPLNISTSTSVTKKFFLFECESFSHMWLIVMLESLCRVYGDPRKIHMLVRKWCHNTGIIENISLDNRWRPDQAEIQTFSPCPTHHPTLLIVTFCFLAMLFTFCWIYPKYFCQDNCSFLPVLVFLISGYNI